MASSVFLTGAWRFLAMLNFRIDPAVVLPYVPAGTELETWQGDTLISVVGFRFEKTRVLGVPLPFHRNFTEANLRTYVTRRLDAEVRRGVTFIREIVPRRAIAAVARLTYNEPYVACPMRSRTPRAPGVDDAGRVMYEWQMGGRWHGLSVTSRGAPRPLVRGSEAEFITEHFWGYTAQRDGSTLEYEVRHPSWRVWDVSDVQLACDVAAVYGPAFVDALSAPPWSAFLAEGSDVEVLRGRTVG